MRTLTALLVRVTGLEIVHSVLLMETGDGLLTETGDSLLLET